MCNTVVVVVVVIVLLATSILAVEFVVAGNVKVLMLAVVVAIAIAVSGGWVVLAPVPPFPGIVDPGLCCWWVLSVWLRCVDSIVVVRFPY